MRDIVLRGVCKSFDGKAVLRGLSATLPAGRVTAVMAPSGVGKTTLLRLLMGLERPDAGEILGLDGARCSAVFQEDRLLGNLTPVGNIRLVNPRLAPRDVEEALAAVGLSDSARQRTEQLSGGMRRRVAILRALMAESDLVLLDEPFKGLDEDTKALVMEDARRRIGGRTAVLVTHDRSECGALGAERILTL